VVDGSDVNPLAQIEAVRQVIRDVVTGAAGATTSAQAHDVNPIPELLVVNKADVTGDLAMAKLRRALPGALFVSATTGEGLDMLRRRMGELAEPTDAAIDVVIPYHRGDLLARVHADGRVQESQHNADGTRIRARVPVALAARLSEFAST
jgi:GTP-binding protein HflX